MANSTRLKSIIRSVIFIGLGVVMLLFAFRGQNVGMVIQKLEQANYYWVALAALFAMTAHYVRALRWNMLIAPLGFAPKPLNTFIAVLVGYMANLAFPRLGEVLRCGTLNKTERVPVDKLIGTVITERIVDLLSLVLILLLTLVLQFKVIGGFIYTNLLQGIIEKGSTIAPQQAFGVIAALGLILFLSQRYYKGIKNRLKQTGIGQKLLSLMSGMGEGLGSISKLTSLGRFIGCTVLLWLLYLLSTYIMFLALPGTSQLTLFAALFVLAAGSIGMAAPVQGGIGAFHWIVAQGLLLYSIPESDGLAYATISHGTQTLMIILFGAAGMLYTALNPREK